MKAKIKQAIDERNHLKESMEMDGELLANIRSGLQQILELTELVDLSLKIRTMSKAGVSISESGRKAKPELLENEGAREKIMCRVGFSLDTLIS